MKNNTTVNGGIGFTGLLQIVFIVLKLCHVINWSWWLVLLPALITCGVTVVALIVLIICFIRSVKK